MHFGGLLYMVAYNLRKVENRDRYPDPPRFCFLHFSPPLARNKIICPLLDFVLADALHPPPSELAQRKRVGLITQRSYDRNVDSLFLPLLGAKGG